MTITFENTEEDAVAWNVYRVFHTPLPRRALARYRIFASLAVSLMLGSLAFALAMDSTGGEGSTFEAMLPLLAAAAIGMCAFTGVYALRLRLEPRLIAGQTRTFVKRGDFNRLFGKKEVSVRPEGLRIAFAEGETTLKWTAIRRWAETDTHVFLFWSDNDIIGVPKRAFASEAQRTEFLALVDRFRAGAAAVPVPIAVDNGRSSWWHSRYGVESETPDVNVNRRG
jgi:hypothetical protein